MHKLKKSVVSALALTMLAGSMSPLMTFAADSSAIYDANGYGDETAQITDGLVKKKGKNMIEIVVNGDNIEADKIGYAIYKDGNDVTSKVEKIDVPSTEAEASIVLNAQYLYNYDGTYRVVIKYDGKVVEKDSKILAYNVKVDNSKPQKEKMAVEKDESNDPIPVASTEPQEQSNQQDNQQDNQGSTSNNQSNTGNELDGLVPVDQWNNGGTDESQPDNTGSGLNPDGQTGGNTEDKPPVNSGNELDGLKPIVTPTQPQTMTPSDIRGLENKEFNIDAEGGNQNLTVYVNKLVENEKVGVKVTKNGVVDNSVTYSVSGEMASRTVTLNIPANNTDKAVKYEVVFSPDKDKVGYNEDLKAVLNQKASENPTNSESSGSQTPSAYIITSFKAKTPNMSSEGGQNSVTVKGNNLPENMYIKVFKNNTDITETLTSGSEKIEMFGVPVTKSGYINIPASISEKETYTVKLYADNKVVKSTDITVGTEGTNKPEVAFAPNKVYLSGDNEITIEAFGNLSEIVHGGLKGGISLDLDGTGQYSSLSENDTVEISGKTIKITLPEYTGNQLREKLRNFPKVKINRAVLKDENDNPLSESDSLISEREAIIDHVEFVKGKVLESNGGEVELKIVGTALKDENPNKTVVEVRKAGRIENQIKIDGVKVEGKGNEQTIKFKLPANTSGTTESYTVRISLNGGRTFTSKADSNVDDKANLLVSSVLPEGKALTDQTLAFMSIQSYGTSGGGDKIPDNTHTNAPTSQGSKKTYVTVYGTNLDKSKTRVRVIDRNGVVWHPTYEAATGNFSMVGFDGSGITGDGNVQMLEIIAPSRYRKVQKPVFDSQGNPVMNEDGTPKMEDSENTYTYEIAVDGIHYNNKITVSATILDDGAGEKKTLDQVLRHVNIKYQTKDGKEIKDPEEIKLNADMPIYITDAMPQGIDGYKYVGMQGFEQRDDIKDAINQYNELKKKDSLSKEDSEQMLKLEKMISGDINDGLNQKVGDRKEIVYIYESLTQDKPVTPAKPVTPDKPVTPAKPVTPDKPATPSKPSRPVSHHSSGHSSRSSISENKASENKNKLSEIAKNATRVSGNDRYETSMKISRKAFKKADKVVLVSGENFADALTAAALTKGAEGPVLLVNDKNIDAVSKEIIRLGAKDVVAVGGQALSDSGLAKINKNAKVSIDSILGKDRYETSVKTAEKVINKFGNKGKVILVDGRNYPDAVSVAPYAAREGIPVILVNGGKLTDSAKEFLKKYNINEAVIIGGEKSVSKSVEGLFTKSTRVAGENRYETSKKIAETYFPKAKKAFIATGENYADALSSGYYAAMNNAPVILTKSDKLDSSTKSYLENNSDQKVEIIGGENSVSKDIFK